MHAIKDSIITGNLTNVEQVLGLFSIINVLDKSKTHRIPEYFEWICLCRFLQDELNFSAEICVYTHPDKEFVDAAKFASAKIQEDNTMADILHYLK